MIVVFDLMDTLVADPYRAAHEAGTGMTFAQFEQRRPLGVYYDLERGRIPEQAYWRSLREHGVPIDPAAFHRVRLAGYQWLPGMPEVVAACRREHRTVIASNYPLWIDEVLGGLGLGDVERFASHQCGYRKPEAEFFAAMSTTLGIPLDRVVLVDDKPDNVAAARALGAAGVLHRSAAQTCQQLTALGVRCGAAATDRLA